MAMPKNKAGFIIATYEGVQVDWRVIIYQLLKGGHRLGEGCHESMDSGGSMAHPSGAVGGASADKEAGTNDRDNPQQTLKAATTSGQAYPRLVRKKFLIEGKETT